MDFPDEETYVKIILQLGLLLSEMTPLDNNWEALLGSSFHKKVSGHTFMIIDLIEKPR